MDKTKPRARSRRVAGIVGAGAAALALITVGATPAHAAVTTSLLYSVDGGATWSAQVTAAAGQTVLVRQWYDNTDALSHDGVGVTTTLPTGFTLTPGSTRVCLSPATTSQTSPDSSEDLCTAEADSAIWTGDSLSVGPSSALFGTAESVSGTLPRGLKHYLNVRECGYVASGTTTPLSTYAADTTTASNSASNFDICATRASEDLVPGFGTTRSIDLLGQRYLNVAACWYINDATGRQDVTHLVGPAGPTTATNDPSYVGLEHCPPVAGYTQQTAGFAGQRFDLLDSQASRRYLYLQDCVWDNSTSPGQPMSDWGYSASMTRDPDPAPRQCPDGTNNGQWTGPINDSTVQSFDLLDTGRAKGFVEYSVVVSRPATQTDYPQSGALTGTQAPPSTGTVTVTPDAAGPIANPTVAGLTLAGIAAVGGVLLVRRRRTVPTNRAEVGGR